MKSKIMKCTLVLFILSFAFLTVDVNANYYGKMGRGGYGMGRGGYGMGRSGCRWMQSDDRYPCMAERYGRVYKEWANLNQRFMQKAEYILDNAEELELYPGQIEKIKELKFETQKKIITLKAERNIIALEMKMMFSEDVIDKDEIKKLMKKKMKIKEKIGETLIEAYIDLKDILSIDQREKLKKHLKKFRKMPMNFCPFMYQPNMMQKEEPKTEE